MKKLRSKFLAALVLGTMTLGLGACGGNSSDLPDNDETRALKEAADYVNEIYKSDAGKTKNGDFERVNKIEYLNVTYPIEWSVKILTTGAPESAVKVVPNQDKSGKASETTVRIDIDEASRLDVEFELSGKIKSTNYSYDLTSMTLTLPKLKVMTFAEYAAACAVSGSKAGDEKNTPLTVEGTITALIGKKNGNTANSIYVQADDNSGAFYVYSITEDPYENYQVGQKVRVSGESALYSGSYEILSGSVTVVDPTPKEIEPVDFTEIFSKATSLTDPKLAGPQGLYVKIQDVVISGEEESSGYYKFKKGALETYIRISSSVCPISTDNINAFKKAHAENFGKGADAEGIINVYNGAFYLTPINDHAFTYKGAPKLTAEEIVSFEADALSLPSSFDVETEYQLPVKGSVYPDAKVVWAFYGGTTHQRATISSDGVLHVVPTEDGAEVLTLTALVSRKGYQAVRTFEVKVNQLVTDKFCAEFLDKAPVTGTFKIADNFYGKQATLYATGEVNSKGALVTTDNAANAADFVFEKVADKDEYSIKVGDKFLVGYKNGTYNNLKLDDTASNPWKWDDTLKVFTCVIDGNTFYYGTYDNKGTIGNTFSLSNVSYISGSNASKVGDTQFPACAAKLVYADYKATALTEAKEGTFKIFNYYGGKADARYATGEIDSKGALVTSLKVDEAADFVFAKNADNKYTIKVGDKFLVGYKNGTYNNMKLDDTASNTWSWDDTLKVFTCVIEGNNFYFGAYDNKGTIGTTFSLSNVSYISGSNASKVGDTQFPAAYGPFELAKLGPVYGEAAQEGTFKIALDYNGVYDPVYAIGEVDSKGALVTVSSPSKAADFVFEKKAGTENGYTIKCGDQYLVIYKNGTYNNMKFDSTEYVWNWNAELKTFVGEFDGKVLYFGNYLKDVAKGTLSSPNMGLSETKYVTGDNAVKVGVSQFIGRQAKVGFPVEEEPAPVLEDAPYTVAYSDNAEGINPFSDSSNTKQAKNITATYTFKNCKAGTYDLAMKLKIGAGDHDTQLVSVRAISFVVNGTEVTPTNNNKTAGELGMSASEAKDIVITTVDFKDGDNTVVMKFGNANYRFLVDPSNPGGITVDKHEEGPVGPVTPEVYTTGEKVVALKASMFDKSVSLYAGAEFNIVDGDDTYAVKDFNNNQLKWDLMKTGHKSNACNGTIMTVVPNKDKITKVTVDIEVNSANASHVKSFKLYVSNNADFSNAASYDISAVETGVQTFTITNPIEYGYYKIVIETEAGSANGFVVVKGFSLLLK